MKSLAFFCSVILIVLPAFSEVTPSSGTPLGAAAATVPNWSAAIQKFGKEGADASPDTVDTRLLIDHLSDNDPLAKSAATAQAPVAGASAAVGKPGATKEPSTGASVFDPEKPGADEDWAASIRHSVRDIVKPFQEFLPGASDGSARIGGDGTTAAQMQGPYVSGGLAPPRRSGEQRRVEKIQSEHLISKLIDEVAPWAVAALVVAVLGYGVSFWVGYVKNKPSVPTANPSQTHARTRSGKKRRRSSI